MEFIILFSIGGLLAGFTAGFFGLGGGAVLVPLFLFLLPKIGATPNVVMHQAVSTSLATIIPSALCATYKQYQLDNLDLNLLKTWMPFVLLGALVTTPIFKYVPSIILKIGFMGYLIACVGYLYFKKSPPDISNNNRKVISKFSKFLAGSFIGSLSIFLGIGGGAFTVPYYIANDYSLKEAIAISSATGLFIGIIGSLLAMYSGFGDYGLAKYSLGYVNVVSLLVMAPFSLFAASLGVSAGQRLHEKPLKILYILFLLTTVGYVYYETFIK